MAVWSKKWRRVLLCLMAVALGLSLYSLTVKADETSGQEAARQQYDDLRGQVAEKDEEIKRLQAVIDSGEATADTLRAQIRAGEDRLALLEQSVAAKQLEITLAEEAIGAKEAEIGERQRAYDERFELFSERLVAIYKMNDQGILSTIFRVSDWLDIRTVTDALQRIAQADTDLLEEIQEERLALECEAEALGVMLGELDVARGELQQDIDELEAAGEQLGRELDEKMRQLREMEAELEDMQRQRAAMRAEMDDVFASLGSSATEEFIGGAMAWPVPGHAGSGYVTSGYGWRTLNGASDFHEGIDIGRGAQDYIQGKPIVAVMDGVVVAAVWGSGGYGNYMIIDHGGGVRTLYAHCDSLSVGVGANVIQGDPIGTVGNTGYSFGAHLHFELRLNNTEKVDPYPYLMGQLSVG